METPALTVSQLDETLRGAEDAVSVLGSALVELEDDITRRLLDESSLSGRTAETWGRARDQGAVLWSWFGALSAHVDACREQRGSGRLKDRELQALGAQLNTPAILLPPESLRLASTCLPGVVLSQPCAVRPLAQVLFAVHKGVVEVVGQASAAWDQGLPRLGEIDEKLTNAQEMAIRAGIRMPNEMVALLRRAAELRQLVQRDPLALELTALDSLAAATQRVQGAIDESVESHRHLAGDLDALDALLQDATSELSLAEQRHRDAVAKIAMVTSLVPTLTASNDDAGRQLAALADVRSRMDTDWRAAAREVRALQPRAAGLAQAARRLAAEAGAPVAQRAELRGRLEAYRAMAQALGRGEDLALEDRYRAARDCLYSSPCDLEVASRLVAAYQGCLRPPAGEGLPR